MTGFLWGGRKTLSLRLCGGFRVCDRIWREVQDELGNDEVKFVLGISILSLHLNKGMLQGDKPVGFHGEWWSLGGGCSFGID